MADRLRFVVKISIQSYNAQIGIEIDQKSSVYS